MRAIIILFLSFVLALTSCAKRVVVTQPSSVTVIQQLPKSYKIVKVRGHRYYYFNGRHYKKTRRGYVLVKV